MARVLDRGVIGLLDNLSSLMPANEKTEQGSVCQSANLYVVCIRERLQKRITVDLVFDDEISKTH